jgi:hypothetical protein
MLGEMEDVPTIRVQLPRDRRNAGVLWVEDDNGRKIAGDYPALGKSDSQTAADKGNPNRDPLQPYGDTPLGDYRVEGFRQLRTRTKQRVSVPTAE